MGEGRGGGKHNCQWIDCSVSSVLHVEHGPRLSASIIRTPHYPLINWHLNAKLSWNWTCVSGRWVPHTHTHTHKSVSYLFVKYSSRWARFCTVEERELCEVNRAACVSDKDIVFKLAKLRLTVVSRTSVAIWRRWPPGCLSPERPPLDGSRSPTIHYLHRRLPKRGEGPMMRNSSSMSPVTHDYNLFFSFFYIIFSPHHSSPWSSSILWLRLRLQVGALGYLDYLGI